MGSFYCISGRIGRVGCLERGPRPPFGRAKWWLSISNDWLFRRFPDHFEVILALFQNLTIVSVFWLYSKTWPFLAYFGRFLDRFELILARYENLTTLEKYRNWLILTTLLAIWRKVQKISYFDAFSLHFKKQAQNGLFWRLDVLFWKKYTICRILTFLLFV